MQKVERRLVGGNEFPIPAEYQDIVKVLPHRYPFLLVDRVTAVDGEVLTAIKNVTANEPFFEGHFPGFPVMPGVLQIEALAQTAALCFHAMSDANTDGKVPLLMSMDKVKFRRPVVPGDQLVMTAKIISKKSRIGKIETKATVDGARAAEAIITAAIAEMPS